MTQTPNLGSSDGSNKLGNIPEPEPLSSEASLPLGLRSGQGSDLNLPTHPDISDLSHIRQEPQEIVHHFWARFLLVMSKVKDCREEDAISFFCKNCTDKGILNAISHRDIVHFADSAAIVRSTVRWKAPGKPKQNSGILRLSLYHPSELKGCTLVSHPIKLQRNQSPLQGVELYWRDGSMGHAKFTVQWIPCQHIALEHVGYSDRWPRATRISSSTIQQSTIPRKITIQY